VRFYSAVAWNHLGGIGLAFRRIEMKGQGGRPKGGADVEQLSKVQKDIPDE
jgi:hypothetical protein